MHQPGESPLCYGRFKTSAKLDQVAWWDAATIMNIFSEVAIVALEIGIMIPLQVPTSRKFSIITLFACRLL
jgi:hypothetical protein